MIKTGIKDFYIKFAEEKDIPRVLAYIRKLAEYEKKLDKVEATEESLMQALFTDRAAEVIFAVYAGKIVGFALFHKSFSTLTGKPGLHLVDLYIEPELRGRGLGKTMLSYLASLAVERGYGRFEWWALNWNEPAIELYKKWGAPPMDDMKVYRMCDDNLKNFANFYLKGEAEKA